jgi:RHS repeat-associated protein
MANGDDVKTITISPGTNQFDYDGRTYHGGDSFQSSNPCELLAFASAFQTANPDAGRSSDTPHAWEDVQAACPAGDATVPANAAGSTPNENPPNPQHPGDSAGDQGAPSQTQTPALLQNADAGTQQQQQPGPDGGQEEQRRPPDGQVDPNQSREQTQSPVLVSDPVDPFSGAYAAQETDLSIPNTILPLTFVRSYRSGVPAYGPLGWNWDHNFNLYLRELATGDVALWRTLHEDVFRQTGGGFEPPRGVFELLEPVAGLAQVYELRGTGGTVMRFERPALWSDGERIPLIRIEDRHGNALRFTYGDRDLLEEVRDDDDRRLIFEYDECGLLVSVSDHAGRVYRYTHDEQTFHLLTVTTPATTDHPAGLTRAYHYADPGSPPELRHNIVRVEDALGNIYLENAYDEDPASWSFARVQEQLLGGYLFQFAYTELQWVPSDPAFVNIPSVQVEVLNPDFGLETYTFNFRGDLLDQRFRLVKDHSYRVVALQYEYDEQGNLTATTKPDGSQELVVYDPLNGDPRRRGLPLQRELTAAAGFPVPSRIVWKGRYENRYQLIKEEHSETGAITSYDYDFDVTPGALTNTGKLVRVGHPDVTLPDGVAQASETRYEHRPDGLVTGIVDPDGARTEMQYGAAGPDARRLVRRIRDATGLAVTEDYAHDAHGHLATTIDANGSTTVKTINALDQVQALTLPAVGGVTAEQVFHYDEDRRVASFVRPRGTYDDATLGGAAIVDRFERDVLGNPTRITASANTATPRLVRSQFDHRGFATGSLLPDGGRITRVFDERGRLISEELRGADGATQTARESYDRSGRRRMSIAAGGATTTYEHDGFGRIQHIVAPSGTESTYRWGEGDTLLSLEVRGEDETGAVRLLSEVRYEYDERGRRIRETTSSFDDDPTVAVDLTEETFYDVADRITRRVDARGGVTTHDYDGVGRLVLTVDPEGNERRYAYDPAGNVLVLRERDVQPGGGLTEIVTRWTYDERGRRTATVYPDGSTRTVEYDDRDVAVAEIDPLGTRTEIGYDAFSVRVSEVVDAGGLAQLHRWELDTLGRHVSYTDPTGEITHYALDGLGRRTTVTYPNGVVSQRSYDAAGNEVTEQLSSGVAFAYDHDGAERLTRVRNTATPAGIVALADQIFAYDGIDRLVSARLGADIVERRYDSRGRLRSERSGGSVIRCAYNDLAGTLTRTWPDGRAEEIATDLNEQPTTITEIAAGVLGGGPGLLATLIADGPVHVGRVVLDGGVAVDAAFDDRKRLVEVAAAGGGWSQRTSYRYDRADRRRVEALSGPAPTSATFSFDPAGRLLGAAHDLGLALPLAPVQTQADHDAAIAGAQAVAAGKPVSGFDYDAADARVLATESGQPNVVYSNFPGHRPATAGAEAFTYDASGVRASDGAHTFDTDALGRIVAVRAGAVTVCELHYDALGRPSVLHQQGRPARGLQWFGGHVVQETDAGAAVRQHSLHPTTGAPVARHVAGETLYPLVDGRANLVGLADRGAGALLECYRYAPFGVPSIFGPGGAPRAASGFDTEARFGGQRYLDSAGLYLATRRLMDPRHGVFLSPDPLGYALSPSLYAYAAQDPLDLIDPEGEFAFLAILAVMAIGAVVAGGLNATRQGIAMAENPARRAQGFSWSELGISMGLGAVIAPILVVAPEVAIPLAGLGVAGGAREIANGNYATGTFDIVTSLAPFGFKGPRTAAFGEGSLPGQVRGLGPATAWSVRTNRFNLIEANLPGMRPAPTGPRIGIGVARISPDATRGHSGVLVDENGALTLFHKNGQIVDGETVASWQLEPPPPEYWNGHRMMPWRYETIRVPRSIADMMSGYARSRMSQSEPFAFGTQSCGNFTSDVFAAGGLRGMASSDGAIGVYNNVSNFFTARNMSYAAGFWGSLRDSTPNRKCAPGELAPAP